MELEEAQKSSEPFMWYIASPLPTTTPLRDTLPCNCLGIICLTMSEQLPAPSNGALQPPNLPDGRVDTELYVPAGAIPTATPTAATPTTAPLDTVNGDVHMMDVSHDQPRVGPLREELNPIPTSQPYKRSMHPPASSKTSES
jgi:hypothetical protein